VKYMWEIQEEDSGPKMTVNITCTK